MKFIKITSLFLCSIALQTAVAQEKNETNRSQVWVADNGDGTYKNPIINADYSDPDAIRVGDDYYMTSSSFNCIPGLPILHSKDMVNWELVNYALKKQPPFDVYDKPGHGNGVWAPSIRFHNEEFYIYYPDPDYGIYMIKTKDPKGDWSEPIMVKEGKGLIDPCPLWDDDGKAYLAYAYAGSRAGFKSLLAICSLNPEGTVANYNDDVIIIDGHDGEATIEGPKLYKRNGYYYVFAPAGGVPTGWQTVLRSKNIWGPYEKRKVMDQGKSKVNGPHQGAWVQTQTGEDWFFHFQDKFAYGRVVHLQPMKWIKDWPVIGTDKDGDGTGEPVVTYKKPNVGKTYPISTPPDSDEFNSPKLGLQWQWHANQQVYWGFPSAMGYYTMYCRPMPKDAVNLFDVGNLLLQKFPADEFTATTKMTFNARFDDEQTGLMIMGLDYSYLKVKQTAGQLSISQVICTKADKKGAEKESDSFKLKSNTFYLQVKVKAGGICNFFFSEDGKKFTAVGTDFTAKEGKWIGAKLGFLALRNGNINDAGSVRIDWFRITK
jgi:beta-xylosidase